MIDAPSLLQATVLFYPPDSFTMKGFLIDSDELGTNHIMARTASANQKEGLGHRYENPS